MSGFRERYRGLRPGLAIGPHTNNQDFWDILFGRPSAFVLLLVIGGIRWVTPNLLTALSLLLKLTVAAMILWGDTTVWLWSIIVLQLSYTLDCADGQLARYRKVSSAIGSYFDKIVDTIGFLFVFAALAHVCVLQTGELYYAHLATLTIFALLLSGYVKWVAIAEILERGGTSEQAVTRVPKAVKWWHIAIKLFEFTESDLHLWIAIGLAIAEPTWIMWLLAVTQTIMVIAAVIYRGAQLARSVREASE